MPLIKCPECQSEISDQALNCPKCGKPMKQNASVSVQFDTAPQKRRKYRVRFLIFAPIFFVGLVFAIPLGLIYKSGWVFFFFFIVGLVGFIGMIASAIGSWLARP